MPISFLCATCGKAANVSDKFAGRKVKCKCGTVGVVARPAPKADEDLLNMDLNSVQFNAVAPVQVSSNSQASKPDRGKALSRRQREDKALAEKLGQDWKAGPKSDYVQVDDQDKGWFGEAWGVIKSGPVPAFYGYLLGSLMLIFGLHMLIWLPDEPTFLIRRLRRIPGFLVAFGGFTSVAGLFMFAKGICKQETRKELTGLSIGMMVGVATAMLLITLGSLIWLIAGA